jgi:hypothetical protein
MTIVMIENDVSMVSKAINLFAKRVRSKALSAVPLSSGRFVNLRRAGSDFPPSSSGKVFGERDA